MLRFSQEAVLHRSFPDKIFLRRKRRIEVKLDPRLAAQVLAGITALTHRDHADERTLSGLVLKARCVNSVKQWSSERRRPQAPEGGVIEIRTMPRGHLYQLTAVLLVI